MKAELEFGQLPTLEMDDGSVMSQSNSILRALGMSYGFYSEDPIEMWLIDSTIDACYDIFPKMAPVHFAPSDDVKKEVLQKLL